MNDETFHFSDTCLFYAFICNSYLISCKSNAKIYEDVEMQFVLESYFCCVL